MQDKQYSFILAWEKDFGMEYAVSESLVHCIHFYQESKSMGYDSKNFNALIFNTALIIY